MMLRPYCSHNSKHNHKKNTRRVGGGDPSGYRCHRDLPVALYIWGLERARESLGWLAYPGGGRQWRVTDTL